MLLGRALQFATAEPPSVVLERLAAVVLPAKSIAPLRPIRVDLWTTQQVGKRFVGQIAGSHFKLVLLQAPRSGVQVRGSVVVIVGNVQSHCVNVILRPPLFLLFFLAALAVVVVGALALSFFGPARGQPVVVLPGLVLALAFVVVGWFFRCEATLAEQALNQVLLETPRARAAPKGDA